MTDPTQVKLGFDLLEKLIKWASGARTSRKLDEATSEAFRELLRGHNADLNKVKAVLSDLKTNSRASSDFFRLQDLIDKAEKYANKTAKKFMLKKDRWPRLMAKAKHSSLRRRLV